MIDWRATERRVLSGTRLMTLVAVFSSLAGSLLMFWLGLANTWRAFVTQHDESAGALPADVLTVIHLIGALDRFLIAIVLMFFGYGIYVLFIRPEATPPELGLPPWLHVESIGQLKQTLAEVIIIVLFVLFLRVALETFVAGAPGFNWEEAIRFLALPIAIVLLALALKMAQLHPKPPPRFPPQPTAAGEESAKSTPAKGGVPESR
jgi:uncharacterized membrane protein YqhA